MLLRSAALYFSSVKVLRRLDIDPTEDAAVPPSVEARLALVASVPPNFSPTTVPSRCPSGVSDHEYWK